MVSKHEQQLRLATIERAAQVMSNATAEGWKPSTREGYDSVRRTMENWGYARGSEFAGTSTTLSATDVACYYIDRIDEGEGIQPDSANRELGVIAHWWNDLVARRPDLTEGMEDPVKNKLIADLKKRAKLMYQRRAEPKIGYEISEVQEFFDDGKVSGDWIYDHTRLCLGVMFFHLARSIAAAHIVFRGDWRGPIAASDSDITWGKDEKHGRYQLARLDTDKTLTDLQHSNRFLPFDNGSEIEFATYVRSYIKHYKMPSGTHLLAARTKGEFHETPFTNWSRVTDHICRSLGLTRESYGTQSCRRGCASWLNACGLDFEEVGLLGFWLSSVVRRYTMVQARPRLDAWNKMC